MFFRWRESRGPEIGAPFVSDIFWETVDSSVIAVCKHAQQILGYDGDDAAFEEMDGELMDIRHGDGRPWTLASALGGENSPRWACFCAALCASFPPTPCHEGCGWSSCTFMENRTSTLGTLVSSPYAVLFAPRLSKVQGTQMVDIGGVCGTLCGGEGAFDEAQALRQELRTSVLSCAERARAPVMDEILMDRVLHFLRSSACEFLTSSPSTLATHKCGERDDLGVLGLLERDKKPSTPVLASSHLRDSTSNGTTNSVTPRSIFDVALGIEGASLDEWATALARRSLLRVLKLRAVAAEDFKRAASLKAQEALAEEACHAGRECTLAGIFAQRSEELEDVRSAKRRAVAAEDFKLAAQLKRQEDTIVAESMLPAPGDMERVEAEKQAAVEAENFPLAAELRARQVTFAVECKRLEAAAAALAFKWISNQTSSRSLSRACIDAGSTVAVSQGELLSDADSSEMWLEAGEILKQLALKA